MEINTLILTYPIKVNIKESINIDAKLFFILRLKKRRDSVYTEAKLHFQCLLYNPKPLVK